METPEIFLTDMAVAGRAFAPHNHDMAIDTSKTISTDGGNEATSSCWSCGDMRAAHFCQACGKVQPPAPVDYFAFFGMPRKLNVDAKRLEREFYELSRKLHPDLNARADKREQEWSLEQSSLLNDAYRTLKDPIRRTEYLLGLEGVELEEQSMALPKRLERRAKSKSRLCLLTCWRKCLS